MLLLFKYLLYLAGGSITATAGLASYLAFFQPPFHFPAPTGKHAVGTVTYHWQDTRNYPMASGKELMVQFWYPTDGKFPDTPAEPYAPYFIDHIKEEYKLGWLAVLSRPMFSYATENTMLIERGGRLPIVIFSHGLLSTRNHNTAQCEELASHGYVVVGISHSFGCSVTEFPGGRIVSTDPLQERKQFLKDPLALYRQCHEKIDTWIDDVQMVLDRLEELTSDVSSPWHDRLDVNKIGMFGHSFGGAVTTQLCRLDARIKAGAAMDSPLFGANATLRFAKPFMFLLADPLSEAQLVALMNKLGLTAEQAQAFVKELHPHCIPAVEQLFRLLNQDVYKVIVQGADHLAFCDIALIKEACLLSPLMHNLGVGEIDGFRATEIVRAYLVAFFDKYLKGLPSVLLDGNEKKYQECVTERVCLTGFEPVA